MSSWIKLSPSLLDQWRVISQGLYNSTTDKLKKMILSEFVPNEAMSRGTAYHEIIENGPERYYDDLTNKYRVYEKDLDRTWEFSADAVAPAIQFRNDHPDIVHEVWGKWKTSLYGHEVRFNMRLDGMEGVELHECKTKSRKPKYTDYWASMQWRLYLMAMPEAERINYHVFQLDNSNSRCSYWNCEMLRYEGMVQDIQYYLTGFIQWAESDREVWEKICVFDIEEKDISLTIP